MRTTSATVSKSRRTALWTASGIATGSLLWASAAALGVASVLEALPPLGFVLKALGIAYLVYFGVKLLRSKGFAEAGGEDRGGESEAGGFRRGLLVNMTNPKSAAYHASVFAAFLTPESPAWALVVLVGSIAGMPLGWRMAPALGFSTTRVKARDVSISKHADRLCGAALLFLGFRLARDSR